MRLRQPPYQPVALTARVVRGVVVFGGRGSRVSGIRVDPGELAVPARRFEVTGDGLDLLTRVLVAAGAAVAGAAGHPVLAGAAAVYGRASGTVGDAFADESRLLGGKIRAAAVSYRVTDETAVRVHSEDVAPDHRGRAY